MRKITKPPRPCMWLWWWRLGGWTNNDIAGHDKESICINRSLLVEATGKVMVDRRSCPMVELRESGIKTKQGNELSREEAREGRGESGCLLYSLGLEMRQVEGISRCPEVGGLSLSCALESKRRHCWEREIMGGEGRIDRYLLACEQCDWNGVVEHYDGMAGCWGEAATWRGVSSAVWWNAVWLRLAVVREG
uniref:Uncharacterized protein n=1 Tax=Oryza punctata TaxID=4537 RepID=A0A0E0L056_ORYPU